MIGSPVVSRTLTLVAVGFLTFDGLALAGIGLMSARNMLVAMGLVFFVSAGLVLLYWRWHRQRLRDIASERGTLSEDVRDMQRLLRERSSRD
jgi:membrane protein implicated in regulation of membrane protease activity